MTVGIVGLGLIGGSLAKAIKRKSGVTVLGYDIREQEVTIAKLCGAVDGELTKEKIPECEVILVAVYPRAIIRFVKENAENFAPGALVVDCGGVKEAVLNELHETVTGRDWSFIGGHPMAGREYSGFRYAKDDLFDNASMILTPTPDTPIAQTARAKEFFLSIGFRRVVFATPAEHDEKIAYTSQMAHILSSAYVRSELALKHKGFSAGSFQDMTRVARLNEDMWAELFMLNREPLLRELDDLLKNIASYRTALEAGDEEALKAILREGRERKEFLDD